MDLDKNYWEQRYLDKDTGWDARQITTPLKEYVDQLDDPKMEILIPGAGNGYEAEYLFRKGFTHTYVIDLSQIPLGNLKNRCPEFPDAQLLEGDFFELKEHTFDLILEQTFFCALDPRKRAAYAEKMHGLLKSGGRLAGVLFDDALNQDKPPFGGNKEEYISYFRPWFEFRHFETCYNSIPPRAGRELFIELVKKEA